MLNNVIYDDCMLCVRSNNVYRCMKRNTNISTCDGCKLYKSVKDYADFVR